MIPDEQTILRLYDTYALPEAKRNHCTLVAKVAVFLATRVSQKLHVPININLLYAGAMLHDIDKNIQKAKDEHHPDTGVRVLKEHGFIEVSNLIRTHSLPAILDQTRAPKTWEEKLLYLSDKMVKSTILTVDERFQLWRNEPLSQAALLALDRAYPKVKDLEKEVFDMIGITPKDVSQLA